LLLGWFLVCKSDMGLSGAAIANNVSATVTFATQLIVVAHIKAI